MSAQGTAPLVIERLTVRADRVVCDVVLAPGVPRRTTSKKRVQFALLSWISCARGERP